MVHCRLALSFGCGSLLNDGLYAFKCLQAKTILDFKRNSISCTEKKTEVAFVDGFG